MKNRAGWVRRRVPTLLLCMSSAVSISCTFLVDRSPRVLQAGAAVVDVTPTRFPVVVNGMFEERTADSVHDPQRARALVLDDGSTRIAIVVVDNLMLPRDLLEEAKELAHGKTGIPVDRMLISATHTHSAGSVMGCLGSDVDEEYRRYLPVRIALTVEQAAERLQPARIGWTVTDHSEGTNCRRWILRPDRIRVDPFGERTVRAMMHPGFQNPDFLGPAGPVDSELSLLAVQSVDGRPLALLANYSMHYFGSPPLSADYFGLFAEKIEERIGGRANPHFVGIMSQGTSGDLQWMDYGRPRRTVGIEEYTEAMAEAAYQAYRRIEYSDWVPLDMREQVLELGLRLPDEKRLAWAEEVVARLQGEKPRRLPDREGAEALGEIYAREQVLLVESGPTRHLKLQAIRVGDLGITAIPNEVFGITGLKIKAMSPLTPTFNISLANGAEGYIPPPEQHLLGGYTTWAARTAGLEAGAEPEIVETLIRLLEEVADHPRRAEADPQSTYSQAVLASRPAAYWRLGEYRGDRAADAGGRGNHGRYEGGIAFYLEGFPLASSTAGVNRAAHFAGGRMEAQVKDLGSDYTLEMWFYNVLPADVRDVTGHLFWRGSEGESGDHLAIGGTAGGAGRVIFFRSRQETPRVGSSEIRPHSWNHLVMVREGDKVTVYLNGRRQAEIFGETGGPPSGDRILIGGAPDERAGFEGKIDEVSLYDRALTPEEVEAHYAAAN